MVTLRVGDATDQGMWKLMMFTGDDQWRTSRSIGADALSSRRTTCPTIGQRCARGFQSLDTLCDALSHPFTFVLGFCLLLSCNVKADVLAGWALTADGTGTNAANVTAGTFNKGSGVGTITFGATGAFADSWTTAASVDANDYFTVTVTPDSGYRLTITNLSFGERRSGTGIRAYTVRCSTNAFSNFATVTSGTPPDDTNERSVSAAFATNVASGTTLEFRFYGYSSEAAGGTWRINDGTLKIQGTVDSASAPDIEVRGSNSLIADGDATPTVADHTDFASVGVNQSNLVRTFTVTNSGSATLGIGNVTTSGTHAADFIVISQPSASLAAGGSTTFQVRFDPSAAGERNATLQFTNDVSGKTPYDFAVRGTGVLAGILRSPTTINVTTMVGSSPSASSFGVTNEGLGRLDYDISTNVGWLSVSPVSAQLNEQQGQQETVSFNVNGLSAGFSNGIVTITSAGASNSPHTVSVNVTLTNIPDPTAQSAATDGKEMVRLAWTKVSTFDVMIAYREGSAPGTPANGTSYSVGSALPGGGTVIYSGTGAALEHIVRTNASHYYVFHSINNNHYSPGVSANPTTGSYGDGEIADQVAYTNGVNLHGMAGGIGWTNAWSDDNPGAYTISQFSLPAQTNYPTTNANKIAVTPPSDVGRQAYRYFNGYTAGKVYAALKLNIQFNGPNKYSGMSFMHGGTEKMFFGEMYGGDQRLGIGGTVSGSNLLTGVGNDYIVIARYDFGTDVGSVVAYKIGSMTVPEAEPSTWHATYTDSSLSRIDGIRLASGAGASSGTPGATYFDEVRVATNWSELLRIVAAPEIAVLGTNQALISTGDSTPATADGTDFGPVFFAGSTAFTNTFSITNSGNALLTLSGITTSSAMGAEADFSVLSWPASVAPGTKSNLVISFNPTAPGVRTALVSIASNDGDENPYTFVLAGEGTGSFSTITFQGFEGASDDAWNYTMSPNGSEVYVDGDTNATSAYALTLRGSDSLNADPYVEFDNIDISGYSAVTLQVAFAVAGADSGDNLELDLSYDGGVTWNGPGSVTLVSGASNTNLGFTGIGSSTVASNPWMVSLPSTARQVRVRIRFNESVNANTFDRYFFDDVRLTGAGGSPAVSLGGAFYTTSETNGTLTVPVSISYAADATVRVVLAGSALSGGTDYSANSTNIVFLAGGSTTSNLVFTLQNDTIQEGLEDVAVRLVNASGAVVGGTAIASVLIKDDDAFTVMAGNLTSGTNLVTGTYTYDETAQRIIRRLQPDVLAIQEWKFTNASARAFVDSVLGTNYHFYIEPESDGSPIPNGVISRWPIIASNEWTDSYVGSRDHVHVTIDLPGSRNLNVISTHFKAGDTGSDATDRINQARELTNYIASASFSSNDYLVIAGDLNLTNRSETSFQIVTQIVTDAEQPVDQNGVPNTNLGLNRPYDHVLPNDLLNGEHLPLNIGGHTYTSGAVFVSAQFDDHLLPVLVEDSYTINRTHHAILKLFNLSTAAIPPTVSTTIATATNQTTATSGGNVTSDGGAAVTNRGVVWAVSPTTPTVPGAQSTNGTGTGSYSSTLTNLIAGQTYTYRAFAQSSAGTGYGATYSLTTPCFTGVVTGVYASVTNDQDFTATWTGISGAAGYRFDVSTNMAFSGGLSTFRTQDFEPSPASPTATYSASGGGILSGSSASGDRPAISPFYSGGTQAYSVVNGTATITFDAIDTSSLTDLALSMRLASFSIGSTGNGADVGDIVTVSISPDNGVNYYSTLRVLGNGNAYWSYADGAGVAETVYDGDASPVDYQPAAGGNRTTDGYSTLIVSNLPAVSQLRIRVTMLNNATAERWNIDDVQLTAVGTSFVPGYDSRAVSGTSVAVTGLTAGVTYYYRVFATNEFCATASSSTSSVTTLVIAPVVIVEGNGVSIPDGDTTPSVTDHSDFGSVGLNQSNLVHTFTITNSGNASLSVGNVTTSGAAASDFTVLTQPASPVAAGAATTFQVRFDPSALGARTATIQFTNNVPTQSPFNFVVQGTGVAAGIFLSPVSISVTSMVGSAPAGSVFSVTNVGLGRLDYTVTTNAAWLSVLPMAANLAQGAGQTETISFNGSGLSAGTSNATVTVTDSLASNNPQSVSVSLVLTNIPDPSIVSANADGREMIRLGWTKHASFNVMIVHRSTNTPSAPIPGQLYAVGDTYGANGSRVIYTGAAASLEHIVTPGQTNHYAFYSINNNHYSPGVTTNVSTTVYPVNEIVEQFAYTNAGTLTTSGHGNGGNGWTGAWSGDNNFNISSGNFASISGYPTGFANRIRINSADLDNASKTNVRQFAAITTGRVYAAYIVNYAFGGANKYAGMSFMDNSTEELYFGEGFSGDQKLAVGGTTSTSNMFAGVGNDHVVIGMYDFDADTGYVVSYKIGTDTVPSTEPGTWHATFSDGSVSSINGIRLAAGGSGGGVTPGDTYFDEIRVATTWELVLANYAQPEIAVLGTNLAVITTGDTPDSGNGTDFGATSVAGGQVNRTLFITNSGPGALNISGVATSGVFAADFSVLSYPTRVSPFAVSNLVLRFDPVAAGARTATVTVVSDDADEAAYNFYVKGTGQVPPTVTTTIASATNTTTATSGGNVTDEGYASVTNRGVVWNTSINPTVPGAQTADGTGTGGYASTLTNLTPGATYYYRAFAQNSAGTAYGTEYSLTTPCFSGVVTGLYVSVTNEVDFTSAWSNFPSASGYALDVSTNATFSNAGGNITITNEGFAGGTTPPSGWTFTSIGGTYTTSGNYGDSSPSLQLNGTGDRIETIALLNPTNVTFWIKGQATDASSSMLVESASAGSWSTVSNVVPLPTSGTTISCALGTSVTNVRFTYTRSAGNLSFDDVIVTGNSSAPSFVPGYSNRSVSGTSASVTGLTVGATYYLRVRATNAFCITGNSTTSTVTTLDLRPDTPTGLTASDGTSAAHVAVSWNDVATETGYVIWRGTNSATNTATVIGTNTANVTTYNDTTAVPGQIYWYRVSSTNLSGSRGLGTSNDGYRALSAPATVTASDGTSTNHVEVMWSAVTGATSYSIWRHTANDTNSATDLGAGTPLTYLDTTANPGQQYYYWVKATNNLVSIQSDFGTADGGYRKLATVPGLSASYELFNTKVEVQWTDISGETGYSIWRHTADNTNAVVYVASVVAGSTNYSDTSAPSVVDLYYWVRGTNNTSFSQGDLQANGTLGRRLDPNLPIVTTDMITEITPSNAKGGGDITSGGASAVTERGVVWSTNTMPTTADNKSAAVSGGTGAFTNFISPLIAGQTYYVRAYASNSYGIVYGTNRSFTATCFTNSLSELYANPTNAANFTANWMAFPGAAGYRIDVSTNSSFGLVGTIRSQGFEGAVDDTWSYTTAGSVSTSTTRKRTGTYSLRLDGASTASATFNSIALPGTSASTVTVAFSASGPDSDDDLYLSVCTYAGGVLSSNTIKLVDGFSDANVAFNATNASNPTTVATNPYSVAVSASATQVYIVVYAVGLESGDYYYLDDISLSGVNGHYVSGYENRTVAGASVSVTGLLQNTLYYYRVRPEGVGGCVGGHSTTSSVVTIAEPVIGLSTNALNFGSVAIGVGSSLGLLVTNSGYADVVVSSIGISGGCAGSYSVSPGAFSVTPGTASNVVVTFTPSVTGACNATLTVNNNTPGNTAPTVSLTGTGYDSSSILAPVSVTSIVDGAEMVVLNWQKAATPDVIVLWSDAPISVTSLTGGTAYAAGDSGPAGTRVIYHGNSDTGVEFITGPKSTNYFRLFGGAGTLYSTNYNDPAGMPAETLKYEVGEIIDQFAYTNNLALAQGGQATGQGWNGGWTGDTNKYTVIDTNLLHGGTGFPDPRANKIFWQDTSTFSADDARVTRKLATEQGGRIFFTFMMNYQYDGTEKYVGISLMSGTNAATEELFFGKLYGSTRAAGMEDPGAGQTTTSGFDVEPGHTKDYMIVGELYPAQKTARMWAFYQGGSPIPEEYTNATPIAVYSNNSLSVSSITGIRLSAGSSGTANKELGHVYFDEVHVGSTWDEVLNFNIPKVYDYTVGLRVNGTNYVTDGSLVESGKTYDVSYTLYHRSGIDEALYNILSPDDGSEVYSTNVSLNFGANLAAGRQRYTNSVTNRLSVGSVDLGVYTSRVFMTANSGKSTNSILVAETGGATDLFFGEFGEGNNFDKFVEIYNGTGGAIDLSQYMLASQTAPGDKYVIWENWSRLSATTYWLDQGETLVLLNGGLNGAIDGSDTVNAAMTNAMIGAGRAYLFTSNNVLQVSGDDPVALFRISDTNAWIDVAGIGPSVARYIMRRTEDAEVPRSYPLQVSTNQWDYREWDNDRGTGYTNFLATAGVYDRNVGLGGYITFTVVDDDTTTPQAGTNSALLIGASEPYTVLVKTNGQNEVLITGFSFINNTSVTAASQPSVHSLLTNAVITWTPAYTNEMIDLDGGTKENSWFGSNDQLSRGQLNMRGIGAADYGFNSTAAWIQIEFELISANLLILSWAEEGGANTFDSAIAQWSLDGVNFSTNALWPSWDPDTGSDWGTHYLDLTGVVPAGVSRVYIRIVLGPGYGGASGFYRMDNIQLNGYPEEFVVSDGQLAASGGSLRFRGNLYDTNSGLNATGSVMKVSDKTGTRDNAWVGLGNGKTNGSSLKWDLALSSSEVTDFVVASATGNGLPIVVNVDDADNDRTGDADALAAQMGQLRVNDDDAFRPRLTLNTMRPRSGVVAQWKFSNTVSRLPTKTDASVEVSEMQAKTTAGTVSIPRFLTNTVAGGYALQQSGWQNQSKYWFMEFTPDSTMSITNIALQHRLSSLYGPTHYYIRKYVSGVQQQEWGPFYYTGTNTIPVGTGVWYTASHDLTGTNVLTLDAGIKTEVRLHAYGCNSNYIGAMWGIYDLTFRQGAAGTNGVTEITDAVFASGSFQLLGETWDSDSGLASTNNATAAKRPAFSLRKPDNSAFVTSQGLVFNNPVADGGATNEASGGFANNLPTPDYMSVVMGDYTGEIGVWDYDSDRTADDLNVTADIALYVVDNDVMAPTTVGTVRVNGELVPLTPPTTGTARWTNNPLFMVSMDNPSADIPGEAPLSVSQRAVTGVGEYRVSSNSVNSLTASNRAAFGRPYPVATTNGALANYGFEMPVTNVGWTLDANSSYRSLALGGTNDVQEGTNSLRQTSGGVAFQIIEFRNIENSAPVLSVSGRYRSDAAGGPTFRIEGFAATNLVTPVATRNLSLAATVVWSTFSIDPAETIGNGTVEVLKISLLAGSGNTYWDAIRLSVDIGANKTAMRFVATEEDQGLNALHLFAVDADNNRVGDRLAAEGVPFYLAYDGTPPPPATGLRATDASDGNIFGDIDESSEILVQWRPGGTNAAQAAGWKQSDSTSLSPWDSYIISYYEVLDTNGTPLANATTTTLTRAQPDWSGVLDNYAFTNLVLSNLVFDSYYRITIQGQDQAGNIGLSTSVIGNTDRFVVTQGLARTEMDLMVRWTGPTNETTYRDYDVIYTDSTVGFRNSLSNQWQLLQYTNRPVLIDTGSVSRAAPGLLTNSTYRFYRVAREGRWTTNNANRLASEEVYVAKAVKVNPGENWYSLFSLPDPATTSDTEATVSYVFGTNILHGGTTFADATKITWFASSAGGTTNQGGVPESVIWLGVGGRWYYSISNYSPVVGVKTADFMRVPVDRGFLIEAPTNLPSRSLILVGRLPTNDVVHEVPGVATPGQQEFHVLSHAIPERISFSDLGISTNNGFQGGLNIGQSDEVRILNNALTNGLSAGSLRTPKARIFWRTTDASWRFSSGSSAAGYVIEPDDAVIIVRRHTTPLVWTNRPVMYNAPTKNITP